MNELEKMVWAAAFANKVQKDVEFCHKYSMPIDSINGFSCAELADLAVDKLREAMISEDKKYLYPIKEMEYI